jgi:hypothetical protein
MTETCLKLPQNFFQREEVVLFVHALTAGGFDPRSLRLIALGFMLEFAGQGKAWRPLRSTDAWKSGWGNEALAQAIAHGIAGQTLGVNLGGAIDDLDALMKAALDSGLLVMEDSAGLAGIACPLFNQWNPHLLPGFLSIQKKGQIASAEARRRKDDPVVARQQLGLLQTQKVLDLGELSSDTTEPEIETAIAIIMQIDRAGLLAVRKTGDYQTWMIAAAVRMTRERSPKDIARLLEFLIEARQDPTVPKGAENVLNHLDALMERSAY